MGNVSIMVVYCSLGTALLSAQASGIRAEVNLGPFPFDYYLDTNTSDTQVELPNCPSGSTIRSCMQNAFSSYASQGVTGMRFMFGLCGDVQSTPLSYSSSLPAPPAGLAPACGNFNPTISSVNSIWLAGVDAFMEDVAAYGGGDLTVSPTPSFFTSGTPLYQAVPDTCNSNAMTSFYFEYTVPFPEVSHGTPAGQGINGYYTCGAHNQWFVGWNNIYMAINALLGAASSYGVTVEELDIQNELNLNDFTLDARFLYDSDPGVPAGYTNAGQTDSSTGSVNVLSSLRTLMSNNGFDPLRVFPSSTGVDSSVAGYDCGSVYGDSARLMHLSGAAAGIGGGLVGDPYGWSVTNGLACSGSASIMIGLPTSWSDPDLVDIHSYPCLSSGCPSDSTTTIEGEAKLNYSDIEAFLNSFGPSGWRGYVPSLYYALAMIGETDTTATNGSGQDCDGSYPSYGPQYDYDGYVLSNLNGHYLSSGAPGTVLRAWNVIAGGGCWPIVLTVNPPYVPAP
jgi:hypothetical protein